MRLAQVNIALFRWPLSDARMRRFTDQILPVNQLAEQSDGFEWRYTGDYIPRDDGPPWNDPLLFFNMSVWRDFKSLMRFVALDVHRDVMRERKSWTRSVVGPATALWWIGDEELPDVSDAIRAISSLATNGDSWKAFSSNSPLTQLETWTKARDQSQTPD